MSYSKVELFGGANLNYLHVKRREADDTEIREVVSNRLYLPTWDKDTTMLATYQNSLNASSINIENGTVIGYKVQRLDIQEGVMYQVADTTEPRIQDYNVSSDKEYQYYIFPIIRRNNVKTLGSPIITDSVNPSWKGCTIIGLIETENKNEYKVDEDNIWSFVANVTTQDYVLNIDKTFTDGFGRFSKRNQGLKKYVTGGLDSLVGTVDCSSSKTTFQSNISKIEKWEDFCYSSNLKLFKDIRGRILPVDIRDESSNYMHYSSDSPITTSFSIVQMADYKDISVYGTAVV